MDNGEKKIEEYSVSGVNNDAFYVIFHAYYGIYWDIWITEILHKKLCPFSSALLLLSHVTLRLSVRLISVGVYLPSGITFSQAVYKEN